MLLIQLHFREHPIYYFFSREIPVVHPADGQDKLRSTRAMLAMAICFSANIGGTGTLVGTGSNVVMTEYLNEFDGNPVSFGTWMAFAVPQMLLCLAAAWAWLYVYFIGFPISFRKKKDNGKRRRESFIKVMLFRDQSKPNGFFLITLICVKPEYFEAIAVSIKATFVL